MGWFLADCSLLDFRSYDVFGFETSSFRRGTVAQVLGICAQGVQVLSR